MFRGVIAIGEAMSVGMRALTIAARHAAGEDEAHDEKGFAVASLIAFVLFIGIFVVLPAVLVPAHTDQTLVRNFLEGVVRIAIFLAYILAISRIEGIRRVFQYHGAEHKTIAAHETGARLDIEGVRPFSTIHLRCGTNFLFLVMMISVVVFSLVGRDPLWWRLVSRIILIPVVAAISYEVLRISARHPRNIIVRILTAPGLWLQRITTREPDDDQVEVALAAIAELIAREDSATS